MAATPPPETPVLLLSALGGSITIIIALVGVIYHNLRSDSEATQNQLDEGAETFGKLNIAVAEIKKDIATLTANQHDQALKQMQDHESLTAIKIHHKTNHGEEIK